MATTRQLRWIWIHAESQFQLLDLQSALRLSLEDCIYSTINPVLTMLACCGAEGVSDIASSSAPEVTSLYVTIWVRVGVNRARGLVRYSSFQRIPHPSVLFHRVLDDAFRQLLLVSMCFYTIPVSSVTRHSVEPSGYFVQYIRLSLLSLRRQVESPVQ